VLALLAVIGMTLRQLPGFAFRSPTDYANEMDKLHAIYDPTLTTGVVDALERLQLFRVFSSIWFSVGLVVLILSIVACTIDRLPRLWRQSADIRVVQPDPYYDQTLPDRALLAGVSADATAAILRRHRFVVRRETVDGTTYLYGDRHRWTKMATLLTHTGLVLFLVAAAVTSRLGDEQGLVVAEGDSLTVQPIGTPGLLLVRNLGFDAPGFDSGKPTDFTTHLAVYQDGKQVADKTIRVNDPLTVGGYTFHQNGFGPAPDVVIRDQAGKPLWTGPIAMTDEAAGFPLAEFAVPGRDVALQLLLQRASDGTGILLVLPFRSVGTNADGTPNVVGLGPVALARGESATPEGTDFSVELRGFSDYTLLIAKKDPGQGIVWVAFLSLIVGIVISFWLPRRRVWGRLDREGRLSLVMRADRYVDAGREFGRLLDDLVAARRAGPPDGAPASSGTG
jgi:cytochrome c biogenesis protein